MTLAATDGGIRSVALIRDPARYSRELAGSWLFPGLIAFSLYGISFLLGEAVLLAGAIVLMLRRSHDPLAPWASMMMLWFLLGDSTSGSWFTALLPDPELAHLVVNAVAFSMLAVVLSVFPTGRFEPRWSLAAAIIGVVQAIATEPLPADVSNLLLTFSQGLAVAAVAVRYRRMPPGVGRQQIRWGFFWLAASVLALLLTSMFQALNGQVGDLGANYWVRIGLAIARAGIHGFIAIGITISLLRYRLYDADATISRSITYATLTIGLLLVFTISQKLFEVLGNHYLGGRGGALAGALSGAIAAAIIAPLRKRTSEWTDRHFRSGLSRLRIELPLLVGDLRETMAPEELGDTVLEHVSSGVRASYGALVVQDEVLDARAVDKAAVSRWLASAPLPRQGPVECDRADPLFPMRVPLTTAPNGQVGWLLLGLRPDHSFYGREERRTLVQIAEPVGRALAIALRRRDRARERDRLDAARQHEIATLRGEIETLRADLARHLPFDPRIAARSTAAS